MKNSCPDTFRKQSTRTVTNPASYYLNKTSLRNRTTSDRACTVQKTTSATRLINVFAVSVSGLSGASAQLDLLQMARELHHQPC